MPLNDAVLLCTALDQGPLKIWTGHPYLSKAELPQEGILFPSQFPSLGIFINKKVGFRKN